MTVGEVDLVLVSIAASLLPLAAEQQTQHCARAAAMEAINAHSAKPAAAQKGGPTVEQFNDLKRKLESQERALKHMSSSGAPAGASPSGTKQRRA